MFYQARCGGAHLCSQRWGPGGGLGVGLALPSSLNLCGCPGWLLGKGHRVGRASREGDVPRKAARGIVCWCACYLGHGWHSLSGSSLPTPPAPSPLQMRTAIPSPTATYTITASSRSVHPLPAILTGLMALESSSATRTHPLVPQYHHSCSEQFTQSSTRYSSVSHS